MTGATVVWVDASRNLTVFSGSVAFETPDTVSLVRGGTRPDLYWLAWSAMQVSLAAWYGWRRLIDDPVQISMTAS